MNRKATALLAAVVCALVGTVMLVGYVRTAEARALAGEELVSVLVATTNIEAGTPVDELAKKVTTEEVPAKVRADGAITDLEQVEGLVTAVALVPGEQLVETRFSKSVARSAAAVPSGLHEVTVALDPERALGGLIVPGDTVGVVASFDMSTEGPSQTHLILHKVLVTAVQLGGESIREAEEEDEEDGRMVPAGQIFVTLAVDGPAVERIVYAAERGDIWLSSEPAEASTGGTKIVGRGNWAA